jgi:hypothetical protein
MPFGRLMVCDVARPAPAGHFVQNRGLFMDRGGFHVPVGRALVRVGGTRVCFLCMCGRPLNILRGDGVSASQGRYPLR